MDRFKFTFQCVKEPKPFAGLSGFEPGEVYEGRKYNGMYEVAVKWGNGEQTKLIEQKLFNEFFKELSENVGEDGQDKRRIPEYV